MMGIMKGIRMIEAELASRKQPAIRKMMLIRSRMILVEEMASSAADRSLRCAPCHIQANTLALATM
jgi:hypothetical protein